MDSLLAIFVKRRHASNMTELPSWRPALRPGAVLLRRDSCHLQVGTSPGYVLTDRPGLFSVLTLLDGIRDVRRLITLASRFVPEFTDDLAATLQGLIAAGVVFDARLWDLPGAPQLRREGRAAVLVGHEPSGVSLRSTFRWTVNADTQVQDLADIVAEILTRSGFSAPNDLDPTLHIMISSGEPNRTRFEAAMDSGLDHLRVVVEESRVRIGPLVQPGRTPCVNCHDLHRRDWDAAWPALMTQFGSVSATPIPALDTLMLYHAAIAVAAEAISCCENSTATARGCCLVLGPAHDELNSWPVTFHPQCSCTLLIAA